MAAGSTDQSPTNALRLIVTADDFGIGRRTSEGIIQAHLHGPVTATSLMSITGDHVRASVPLLAGAPNLDVGLHIVLTDCGEKPLTAKESSGLVDSDGRFHRNGKLWQRAYFRRLNRSAIADEIAAQAEMFVKLVGRAPAYVDCHHHAHQLPIVRDALLEVIGHDLLPRITRITVEPKQMLRHVLSMRFKRGFANQLGKQAKKAFAKSWLWTNDFYFGMLGKSDFARPFPWDRFLEQMPDGGAVEWVVHPGLADDTLVGRDGYQAQRVIELEALTSPAGVKSWEKFRPNLARKSILSHEARASESRP